MEICPKKTCSSGPLTMERTQHVLYVFAFFLHIIEQWYLEKVRVNFTVDFKATQQVNLLPFSTCRGNRINNEHIVIWCFKVKVLCILFQVKIFSPCVCLEVELYRQLLLSEIQKNKKDCTEYFERQSIHNKVEKSHPHTKKTPNQMNFDHY